MSAELLLLVLVVVGVALTLWWLVQLVAVARTPRPVWEAAGHSQLVSVMLMIFLFVLGTIVHVVAVRPALRRVEASDDVAAVA